VIDNWLWQSILATILCCQPLGVVGIYFAAQSQTATNLGSYGLARQKAQTAKTWTLWSAGVMLVGVLLWGLLFAIGIASAGF
jgi:fatty acid desaturase